MKEKKKLTLSGKFGKKATAAVLAAVMVAGLGAASSFLVGEPVAAATHDDAFDAVSPSDFDSKLYNIILKMADLNGDGELIVDELNGISRLDVSDQGLTSLKGISNLKKLTSLDASNNSLRNTDALSGLSRLNYLNLSQNKIVSVDGLASLDKLKELNLSHNSLDDVEALSGLDGLETLDLSYNNLTFTSDLST